MKFEAIYNFYPVSIAGLESTKKENDTIVKTGYYDVLALALDNDLKVNKNGLYLSADKSAHSTVNFKLPKQYIDELAMLQPIRCIAELTPLNYSVFIKVKAIDIGGKFVPVLVDSES